MKIETINQVTAKAVVDLLQQIGWKAQLAGTRDRPQISSAINGVNFSIRFVTGARDGKGWSDFTLSAPFAVDQAVTVTLGASWNRRHRFARVYRTETHVMLDMDVVVAGGVSRDHLAYQLNLWGDVITAFVKHLKSDQVILAKTAARKAGEPGAAQPPRTVPADKAAGKSASPTASQRKRQPA